MSSLSNQVDKENREDVDVQLDALRDGLIVHIKNDARAHFRELRGALKALETQDKNAHVILRGALRKVSDRVLHFRLPTKFQKGDDFACDETDQRTLVIETMRNVGDDVEFRFRIDAADPTLLAEVETNAERLPLELDSQQNAWQSDEVAVSSLELIGGLVALPVRLYRTICVGEVIAEKDDDIECWVEIEPGERIRTSFERKMFEGVPFAEGNQFLWSPSEDVVWQYDTDDPLLLAEVEQLDMEIQAESPQNDIE